MRPEPKDHELRMCVGGLIGLVHGNVALGDDLNDLIRNLSRQYIRHHAVGLPQLVIGGGSPFDIVVPARRDSFVRGQNNYRGDRRVFQLQAACGRLGHVCFEYNPCKQEMFNYVVISV